MLRFNQLNSGNSTVEKTQLVLFLVFTWPHLPLLSLTTAKGKRQTKKNDFVVLITSVTFYAVNISSS